jgi:hypothetical protein
MTNFNTTLADILDMGCALLLIRVVTTQMKR